ncbi:MAG: hypothetical protein JJ831_05835 [Prochlorococcus marinus XMU1422]|jgi:hypothetical protein|uniref:hypothetical protein n=1 Tax=unclassified Prochlorococcus TaxID=2627481 RepID=UPI00097CCB5D|nr:MULTISPECIES: hypothetical protein [unclassified Prochlorococcus]MBO6989742.1 hypothetical protein [Prochlorococcus marinus XMU1421]MBO7012821.1 hypothetical protein [Prochlorococcus marinus XMU1422]MCR8542063.1 hypothetical protein [Prochlorococcus marinus XMU1423]AQL29966.1 hypothetical protein BSR22_01695 [Prochlorococcus sp. RS50]AQL33094.1 hypothetical protein BS620_08985 [Prochlorococcus sp. RS01]
MKLNSVDYHLDWPVSIKLKNLREFIITNLEKKGDLIRWSIVDIQDSIDSFGTKKLKIKAVFAN